MVDHDYKIGDKVMLNNHSAYIYKTPYNGLFVITQCWTNGTVALQCGAINIGIIHVILSHMIQMLKILIRKLMIHNVILVKYLLYISVLYLSLEQCI